ncbi:MAG: hybrid sensor histidine kinase/response regulator [Candidatus Aureabacteria bacterium]|nr:hybrid sensor histidine kinase/response regulator [Candidatus Auribacterota bacterium]
MAFDRSEFLSTFHDEAKDHLQKLNEGLLALEKNPEDAALIEEMFREGHTLKGAARMMGFEEIKEVSHCIEDIFGAIHNKQLMLDEELSTLLFESLDVITNVLEEVIAAKPVTVPWQEMVNKLKNILASYLAKQKKKTGKDKVKKSTPPPSSDKTLKRKKSSKEQKAASDLFSEELSSVQQLTEDFISPKEMANADEHELTFDEVKKELEEKGLLNVPLESYSSQQDSHESVNLNSGSQEEKASYTKTKSTELEEYIKVPITKINKLLNLVGEMVINKINSNQKISSLRRLIKLSRLAYKKVSDLIVNVANHPVFQDMSVLNEYRLSLQDVSNDILRLRDEAGVLFDGISGEVSQLDPIIDELQLRMKQIRMLPVGTLFETMPRLVRDIAVAQGKKVDVSISGEETELDKKVLESIKSSLIHLLRNSVDHGLELPEERRLLGKNPKGVIHLKAYHKSGNVIIEVEDDGRGIQLEKVKEVAVRKGLVSINEISNLSDGEIMNFLFYPGFSTAPIITDISGRGVGLDVVKTDIENLKGSVSIITDVNKGTKFILQLPLTVAIIQSLLVRCESEIFAIPLLSVEESIVIDRKEIFSIENRSAIRLRNRTISVVSLKDMLNVSVRNVHDQDGKKNGSSVFIVIINSMEKYLGLEVDEIIGEQEIFIKSLDENFGKLKNVSGATVMGNGQVIVILDILDLFESSKMTHVRRIDPSVQMKEERGIKKRILIAEDSLTTRELERSILESHGYYVDTAVDGLDALNKVQSDQYDLLLCDIQMPKMDGFELCQNIRHNPKLKELICIIVTSLDREEEKRRGIEVGAQAYIVKSAFDQTILIETIKRLIG